MDAEQIFRKESLMKEEGYLSSVDRNAMRPRLKTVSENVQHRTNQSTETAQHIINLSAPFFSEPEESATLLALALALSALACSTCNSPLSGGCQRSFSNMRETFNWTRCGELWGGRQRCKLENSRSPGGQVISVSLLPF